MSHNNSNKQHQDEVMKEIQENIKLKNNLLYCGIAKCSSENLEGKIVSDNPHSIIRWSFETFDTYSQIVDKDIWKKYAQGDQRDANRKVLHVFSHFIVNKTVHPRIQNLLNKNSLHGLFVLLKLDDYKSVNRFADKSKSVMETLETELGDMANNFRFQCIEAGSLFGEYDIYMFLVYESSNNTALVINKEHLRKFESVMNSHDMQLRNGYDRNNSIIGFPTDTVTIFPKILNIK
jgi:hypothetical protein